MNHPPPPKVLVAPLDWGLGHATRCIPIIEGLIGQGCTVVLAGDDRVEALLKKEFPALKFVHLSGYKINYATTGWKLPLKIVAQIPKLLSAIKAENEWLKKIVREEKIEAVISDNRYGLYHPNIVSVFVTHQLRIKAPVPFIEALLQKLNYSYIHRFHFCWVPDEKEKGLAGELSHPKQLPAIPLTYLGALSRLKKEAATGKNLLIILSGPEPQRSILEEKLVRDLAEYQEPVVLVRGLPGANGKLKVNEKVKVYNHLTARELQVE